ncbi:toxin-antitoxin system YwqK family antitoxin, partial [bacterium]|nr:toxin-antitoxin system YwqK family antitoxin [bacterium]
MFTRYLMLTMLLAAGPLFTEGPSFELDETESTKPKDRTYTVSSADELATLGITGHGAREVGRTVQQALKDRPEGTKVRVVVGIGIEGSVRWTYFYPRSVVPIDDRKRPDGIEFLAVDVVSTSGYIASYRLIPWKNGIRHGIEKEYAGKALRAEVPWKNGKMHGPQKTFFPNGKVRSETVYVDGVANGPTRLWDDEGHLTSQGAMKDGRLDGRFVEYWPGTKQPRRIINYNEGVTHGLVIEYYRSGKLKRER